MYNTKLGQHNIATTATRTPKHRLRHCYMVYAYGCYALTKHSATNNVQRLGVTSFRFWWQLGNRLSCTLLARSMWTDGFTLTKLLVPRPCLISNYSNSRTGSIVIIIIGTILVNTCLKFASHPLQNFVSRKTKASEKSVVALYSGSGPNKGDLVLGSMRSFRLESFRIFFSLQIPF